jgi:sulfite exporter TauE/SafE
MPARKALSNPRSTDNEKIVRALFLGIASGGACLASCGPLAGAFLVAEGKNLKRSAGLLSVFLAGRFLMYAGWAIIFWFAGRTVATRTGAISVFALADIMLGGWLMYYGFSN